MNRKLELRQIKKTIEDTLTILENNFRYNYGEKITYDELFEMFKDLKVLFNNYESETKDCGLLVIKRYIPLLDLIIKIDTNPNHATEYAEQIKNAYKLGARVSLEHYFVYREWDVAEKDKFFEPRYNVLKSYVHFLQEMVYNPDFTDLVFNAPSGLGKTYPEKIAEAWSYGIDDTGAMLALCSNDDVVKAGSRAVIDEIKSECFGEVFPHLKWNENDKFFFLKETEEKWKLKNAKLPFSYYAKTTNSNVVGSRASKWIHIDDLYADYKEALNPQLNYYYANKSTTVWEVRYIQNKKAKKVITGTLWASGDYIDLKIQELEKLHKFVPHPKYKYTRISEDKSCVIIQIPALDYETGESTCPEMKSTEEYLKIKNNIEEYLWETNFQQRPINPEALFFSYDKIRTYETIPETDFEGSYAVIDATRKSGKDFFAMPIMKKVQNDNIFDYYLKDCLFTRTATKDMYFEIVEKIIEQHIVLLVIESNVTSELKSAVEKELAKRGVTYCEIVEKYNTIPKATRIETEKGVIKKQMVFPKKGMYGINTHMGKFMENLTMYNANGGNANDDAPDSLGMVASEIIEENSKPQKAEPLYGIRQYF